MSRLRKGAQIIALISLFISLFNVPEAQAQLKITSRTFPETGQTVKGRFLEYWESNGGLMQQGYPISPELQERSATDGKIYTVQYFERAVFELHPENGQPFDVLLSLLGVTRYNQKYPNGAPAQRPNTEAGSLFFQETGKRVGGSFLVHFNQFGGVPQQGLPISDEFQERSELDGKVRVVQYFERAVFEWNPSNTPPFNVLLAQLGTFAYRAHQQGGAPQPPLLEPTLPAPLDPLKSQLSPRASGRYLVWNEGYVSGSYGQTQVEFDIRALDLATNQPLNVTTAPGSQVTFALDGSLVAWKSEDYGCSGCHPFGLYATDLATGQEYVIVLDTTSGNPLTMRDPVVAGRNVIWREMGNNSRQRLLAKNVDTGAVIEIRAIQEGTPDVPTSIEGLQAGGRFLVWSEAAAVPLPPDPNGPGNGPGFGHAFTIHAYDFTTKSHFVVLQNDASSIISYSRHGYSLSDNRLVVADKAGNLILIDLIARTQVEIPITDDVNDLHLYGDKLLIQTTFEPSDISGLDLSKPEQGAVRLLEPPAGTPNDRMPRYTATLAGDWLVWSDYTAPQARLNKKKPDLTPVSDPAGGFVPDLPKPAKYRAHYTAAISDRFVLFWDCPVTNSIAGQSPCWMRAFDLGMGREAPSPGLTPERVVEVVLAGSLLVWRVAGPDCAGCPATGIYAIELATSRVHNVAVSPISRYNLAAYGRNVVWVERVDNVERIVGKNLDTGEYKSYREIENNVSVISHLQITDVFMAWNEQDTEHMEGQKSSVKVYDLQIGEVSSVFSYDWDRFTIRSLRIALDINRIAIKYGSTFFVRDLLSDVQTNLNGDQHVVWMQLRLDALVYASVPSDPGPYGGPTGVGIYGVDLKQPGNTITLVPRHPSGAESYYGGLAGPWLVFNNRIAQQSRLLALRLPEALWR